MNVLSTITDKSLGLSDKGTFDNPKRFSQSARAIVFREDGKIAIQHVTNRGFHSLPGGTIEPGETIEQALHREIKEEVGCEITIRTELGSVKEYRNETEFIKESFAYVADVASEFRTITLTQDEVEKGLQLKWMNLDEAIDTIESDAPDEYNGTFINARALLFLHEAKKQKDV